MCTWKGAIWEPRRVADGSGGMLTARAGVLPGWGGWAVAVQDLGSVRAVGGGGPVRVQDHGPAPQVDHHMTVKEAEQPAIIDTSFATIGLRGRMVDLTRRRGLVAAAR